MHGIGNDFILIDQFLEPDQFSYSEIAKKLCDRRFGIGADGLLLIAPSSDASASMRIFNADGSEPEMCGNGLRCAAIYLHDQGRLDKSENAIQTIAGTKKFKINPDRTVTVEMGKASCNCQEIDLSSVGIQDYGIAIDVGNPHLVIFTDAIKNVPLKKWGRILEFHPYFPEGTNVHFVEVIDRSHLRMITWERGAGATLACGTGACATVLAGHIKNRCESKATVDLPGGTLKIELLANQEVLMTGPANYSFTGEFELS